MCTAIRYCKGDHYFGRNLDLPKGFSEEVTITPRNYPFHFRNGLHLLHHHAMIGMATISGGYPLYYEATNEKGLSMAGLNFPGNAVYLPRTACKDNIAPLGVGTMRQYPRSKNIAWEYRCMDVTIQSGISPNAPALVPC